MLLRIICNAVACSGMLMMLPGCENSTDSSGTSKDTTRVNAVRGESNGTGAKTMRPRNTRGPVPSSYDSSSTTTSNSDTTLSPTAYGIVTIKGAGPAAGAVVTVMQLQGTTGPNGELQRDVISSTTCAKDGKYRVAISSDQTNHVRVTHPAAATMMGMVYYRQGYSGQSMKHDVEMLPASYIRGRVVGPDDQPVAGAMLRAAPLSLDGTVYADSAETTSSADGTFALETVPSGNLGLAAFSDRYVATTQTVTAPAENVVVKLAADGARVEGVVYNALTGEGVAGSSVSLAMNDTVYRGWSALPPYSVLSDELGAFAIDRLPAGSFRIYAEKDKLKLAPAKPGQQHTFNLSGKETTSGIALYIYPGHTIRGTVRNKNTSEPLSGVKVFTSLGKGKENSVLSGSDGRFALPGVYAQGTSAYLGIKKAGYTIPRGTNRYQSGNVAIPLPADKFEVERELQMVPTVSVSGFIRLENEKAVPGAGAAIYEGSYTRSSEPQSVSDAKGYYELEADPYTKVRVRVETRGFPVTFSEVLNLDDRPTSANITLKPGATVIGRVVNEADSPVANSTVKATALVDMSPYSNYQSYGEAESGPDGSFTLANLTSQHEVSLVASHSTLADSDQVPLSLASGETRTDVKLILEAPHYIAGKVTDETSKPLEGVRVSAYERNRSGPVSNPGTQTDKEGKYRLEKLKDRVHYVSAYHNSRSAQVDNVKVDRDDVDLVFKRIEGKGVLIGTVVDARTRQPIKDFDAVAENFQQGMKIEKNVPEPGKFTFTGFRERYGFQLTITSPGYQPMKSGYLSIPEGQTKLEKTFEMGMGGAIEGRVVDRTTKRPIPGVRVIYLGIGDAWNIRNQAPIENKVTDAAGKFHFDKAPAGTNNIQFKPDPPLVEVHKTIQVKHGETADMRDVELGGGATLRVSVLQTPGDKPAENIRVKVNNNQTGGNIKSGTTDLSGKIEVSALSPGYYSITLPDHKVQKSMNLADGDVKEETLKIGASAFKAKVLRLGNPVAGANVQLSGGPGGGMYYVQTDSDGAAEIKDLAAGTWTAQAQQWTESISYMSPQEKVEIGDGQTVEKTFILASYNLRGKVVDKAGKAVAEARVSAEKKSGAENLYPSMSAASGDLGQWKLNFNGAGTYQLTANAKGYGPSKPVMASVAADVTPPETVLELTDATEGGTLVSVTYDITDGKPLKDAWVKLKSTSGSYFDHVSERGTDGVMRVEGIPPGTYDVEVSGWGFNIANHPGVQIKLGESVQFEDVLYECGSFDWTITDKDSVALKDIPVRFVPNDPSSMEAPRDGKTNTQGTYSIRGILPGLYTATASPAGKAPISVQVKIEGRVGATEASKIE